MITPSASSWRSRCTIGLMPSVCASDGSAPGPEPKIARPRVMWSSCTMRWATLNGWWYGSETTPVPSMMRCVRSPAAARNISGDAIISQPEEWCSPHQNSSKPSRSRCARSRGRAGTAAWGARRGGGGGRGTRRTSCVPCGCLLIVRYVRGSTVLKVAVGAPTKAATVEVGRWTTRRARLMDRRVHS